MPFPAPVSESSAVPLDLPASTVYPRSLSLAPVNEARTEFRKICDDLGSQEPRGVDIWTLPGDKFECRGFRRAGVGSWIAF